MAFTYESEIQTMYIAYYGRPADPAGLTYWDEVLIGNGGDLQPIIDQFSATPEYTALFDGSSNTEIVESIYQSSFGRAGEAEGVAYWAGQLDSGAIGVGDIVWAIAFAAGTADQAVLDTKIAAASAFSASIDTAAEAAKYAGADAAADARAWLATIVDTAPTPDEVNDAVAALPEPVVTPDPDGGGTDPVVDGDMFTLTTGRDVLEGTEGNDTFYGDAQQNSVGSTANSFSTGDIIDGGAGNDTVIATIIEDRITDSADDHLELHVRTTSVENVELEVVGGPTDVDAGRMDSVEEFWSDNSDDDLTITDIRLGNLSITKDITFGLRETDFNTDFTAEFDSLSLTNAGDTTSNSQLLVQIADVSTETPATPVLNVSVNLGFTLAGETFNLDDITSADGTYEGLRSAMENAIVALSADNAALADVTVAFGDDYDTVTVAGNTVTLPFIAQELIITDGSGAAFTGVSFDYSAIDSVPGGFLVAGTAVPIDPATSSTLIETNLVLDAAGRGSTAGDVMIGAMSNSDKGVELINVMVDRDSAIASLGTTNGKLQQVVVTSLDGAGDLEIGGLDTQVLSFNANAFTGTNLMLGTTVEGISTPVNDLHVFNSVNAANNTLVAEVREADGFDSDTVYSYNTGTGNDTFIVSIDGDSVDAEAEGLEINASSGDNDVTVTLNQNVSQATMMELDNLFITTTTGMDTVTNIGIGNFDISVGGGTDFVYINSIDSGSTVGAARGLWTVAANTGPATFVDRVLYEAQLTVTFAGFESTVTVETDAAGNFIADQLIINSAIKAAIDGDADLSRLLTYNDVMGNEQLQINSVTEGLDSLTIALVQPTVVTAGAVAGQVNFTATDLGAIQAGLIATGQGDSDATDSAAEVVALVNAQSVGNNLQPDGTAGAVLFAALNAGGTADETNTLNHSTIDMGAGADDLVVLGSNDLDSNTLDFNGNWGNISVKNFFTTGADLGIDGIHVLDFTDIIDNQTDASVATAGDLQSAVRVATTANVAVTALSANTVSTTMFSTVDALDGSATNTFASITEAEILTALQVDGTYGTAAATANLVGASRDSVLFIENDNNLGEYIVCDVVLTNVAGTDATGITSVDILGVLDFGNTIDISVVGMFA